MMKNAAGMDFDSNNLLRALRPSDLDLLMPHMEEVELNAGAVIYEPGDIVRHAYFPCGPTLLSYMVMLDDGRGVETALIGREGAVGGIVSQGRLPAFCRAVVQFSGPALRIETAQLEKAKTASVVLHNFFARYADCLLAQICQSVACNATHTIEQRGAKWLIAVQDRIGENHSIALTQEQLAGMLGVGRSYVGRVLGNLKSKGAVKTMRGKLLVDNSAALENLSCNCNNLVRQHFDDVLAGVYPDAKD
jgi:CRP-like cAMP-binding protein